MVNTFLHYIIYLKIFLKYLQLKIKFKLICLLLYKDRSSDNSFKYVIYPFHGRFFPASEHTDLQQKKTRIRQNMLISRDKQL